MDLAKSQIEDCILHISVFIVSLISLGGLRWIFKQVLSYNIFLDLRQLVRNCERAELLKNLVGGRQKIESMIGEYSEQVSRKLKI